MNPAPPDFAGRVIRWQKAHGRHGLPWQGTRDPYRVWLSEIMLQQTQVSTVSAYFPRFLARFADVRSLAAAPLDDVLAMWSGMGYYSRARNLHRCAQQVVALYGGEFPRSAQALATLPGIGRSTAAAIASFCFGERVAILDGNVKRVLARVLGFADDLAVARHEQALWTLANELPPRRSLATAMPAYTQGLMDLGATVCTARRPACALCPVARDCVAHTRGREEAYPVKARKLRRTSLSLWLLMAGTGQGDVWLARRAARGIWAGLYCLPAFESRHALEQALPVAQRAKLEDGLAFTHVLTHKDLHLHPVHLRLPRAGARALQTSGEGAGDAAWFGAAQWPALGLPAPVRKLLALHS